MPTFYCNYFFAWNSGAPYTRGPQDFAYPAYPIVTPLNVPQLNSSQLAKQAGRLLDLPIPDGRKAEFTLVILFTCPQTVTHPCRYIRNHLIAIRRGVELMTFRCKSNVFTVTPPSHVSYMQDRERCWKVGTHHGVWSASL